MTKLFAGIVAVLGVLLIAAAVVLSMRMKPGGPAAPTGHGGDGTVLHVTDADFDQLVLRSPTPVLVDFFATWCPPCKQLAPIVEELARETPQARIVKVDVDVSPKTAQRYGIRSIPTLIVFQNGEPAKKSVGFASKTQLQNMLGL